MKHNVLSLIGIAVFISFLLASCGSVEITKRRHLPGYHVDLGHKHQQPRAATVAASAERSADMAAMEPTGHTAVLPQAAAEPVLTALPYEASAAHLSGTAAPSRVEALTRTHIVEPIADLRGEKIGRELRRSVFAEEGDEKHGWSVAAIMAFAFGTLAFILMLVAIVSMIGLGPLWFLPAIFGFIFGLAGLITGAIGLKQTRAGGRKGRGFAIAGLISGVIGMVISLVALLIGFVRTIAN
jgi:hypothetical protein